jgi:hypothetical protein
MSYLTIYAHHNFKYFELDKLSIKKNKSQCNILKKLRILLLGQ